MTLWTEDRTATLRRLWDEGASASFIAERLGGITRSAVLGKVMRLGLSEPAPKDRPAPVPKPKAKAKPPRLCVVQGCGEVLGKANQSGVCRAHRHVIGACRCPKCRGEAGVRRATPINRADVRTVLIPSTGNVTSGATAYTSVSLPREPWVTT